MTIQNSLEDQVVPASKTIFGREPAFWTGAVQAALIFLVSFGINLSDQQTGAIIAVVNAVMGAVLIWAVRPINVAVFNTLAQAVLTLVITFGLELSAEQIGAIMGALGIVLSYVAVRPQVVPVATLRAGAVETQPHLPSGV